MQARRLRSQERHHPVSAYAMLDAIDHKILCCL